MSAFSFNILSPRAGNPAPETPSGATPTPASTSAPPLMPPAPKMGGLVQTSKDEFTPWTGGKPNLDWTALDALEPNMFRSPNQQRSLYTKSSTDGFNFRTTGLTTQFGKADNFKQFADKVLEHLQDTGMDTISYLPDPAEPTVRMLSVVTHHSRFTFDSVCDGSTALSASFDYYDSQNDMAAIKFLLNSLSSELEAILKLKIKVTDKFTIVWMYLVGIVTSTSVEKWNTTKEELKALAPSQYPGEDVFALAHDYLTYCEQLDAAGQFNLTLTLNMVDGFILAGGTDIHVNTVYRAPLTDLRNKLAQALREVRFMEKPAAERHMASKSLTFHEICKFAEDHYKELKDSKKWPPAMHAQDSTAVATPFTSLANNVSITSVGSLTQLQFLALMQAGFAGKGACHIYGKMDHWANCCLKKKKKKNPCTPSLTSRLTRSGAQFLLTLAPLSPRRLET